MIQITGQVVSLTYVSTIKVVTEIQYTVTEDAVNGYDATITGDQTTGFTITNTEQPKNVTPPKQNTTTPKTSDSTNIYLYFGMLFVGIITSGSSLQRENHIDS